jgi:hypothetical protein
MLDMQHGLPAPIAGQKPGSQVIVGADELGNAVTLPSPPPSVAPPASLSVAHATAKTGAEPNKNKTVVTILCID